MGWKSHFLLLILAWVLYLHGRTAFNALVAPPLPDSYFSYGNTRNCENIHAPRFKYCEDQIFWNTRDENGAPQKKIIVSCDPGRREWNTVMGPLLDPTPRGDLWVLQAKDGEVRPYRLFLEKFPAEYDFHPLGMDIFPGNAGGPATLFVVNHIRGKHRAVEVFHLYDNPIRLLHIRSLHHWKFWAPNGVAAVSPTAFFLTIDHWFTRSGAWPWRLFMHKLESLLILPLGLVEFVEFGPTGLEVKMPIMGIPFPNGISLSKDKSTLAVASSSAGRVRIYNVGEGYSLNLKSVVPVPFSPDNLEFLENDSLMVTGHPNFPALIRLAKGLVPVSSTWVVAISNLTRSPSEDDRFNPPSYSVYNRVRATEDYGIRTLFQSNGVGWSAGSSGLLDLDTRTLIIIGLYTEGVLVCRGI